MEADGLRGNDRGECTLGKRQRRKRERLCHVEFSLVYRLRRSILQGGTNTSDAANWRLGRFGIAERERYFFPEPLLQFQRHWESAKVSAIRLRRRGNTMKNPLDSLWGTIICGVLLTAVLYFVVKGILT
jgi:hypothetical protein